MTTFLLYRDKDYGRWLATTDNPHVPESLRTAPVFPDGEDYTDRLYIYEFVHSCNPGTLVRFR